MIVYGQLSNAARDNLGVRADHGEWRHGIADFDDPGGNFGEHRREKHRVLSVDDRRAALPQAASDSDASESSADDEYSTAGSSRHRLGVCTHRS
jgi:hypothetical protein